MLISILVCHVICASMIIVTHLTNTMKNAFVLRYYCYFYETPS